MGWSRPHGHFRPVKALRARKKGGEDGRGPAKMEREEREERREKRRRPKAGGVRQRVGRGCGW